MKIWCILFFLVLLSSNLFPQTGDVGTISGFVYDVSNGEALISANVFLDSTLIGSSTNLNGYYVIPGIPPGDYVLVCQFIGYKSFRQSIRLRPGEQREITIKLTPQSVELQRIVVTGESVPTVEKLFLRPVSTTELSAAQINQIPQVAEADLLRAMQTLPGVLPLSDFSSALYIRGGTPDQNLHLVDGTDIYNPEHAFGLFSTFNTDAIKKVELSKGGFGAEYGGRLSSVINVTNLDGNREEFEGRASLSLLSARATLQMPIGRIGSISGSFRRTYFDKTVAKWIEDIPAYYFYDGNIKAHFDLDSKNKLTISAFGSQDVLNLIFNEKSSDQAGFDYDWGNRTGSIRYSRVFTPRLFANFWVTASRFDSNFNLEESVDFTENNYVSDITLKAHFEYYPTDKAQLQFGFEQKNLHLTFQEEFPGGRIDIDTEPRQYAGFVKGSWQPTPLWDLSLGVRYNYFDAAKNFSKLAPRFLAKYRLTETVNVKVAAGRYYQFLHRVPRAFVADVWSASNLYQNASSSNHAILGLQKDLLGFQLEIEGFYKTYQDIYSFNHNFASEITADQFENENPVYTTTEGIFDRGDGRSIGLELFLKKEVGALTGWLGYSLAITDYEIDGVNQGRDFPPRHDRLSALSLVGSLDLRNLKRAFNGQPAIRHSSTWKLGFTFIHTSGQPITVPGSTYFTSALPDRDIASFELFPSVINGVRLPVYTRLDLSLSYEKHFSSWSISPYLQIFNIGNRKNVWFVDYKLENGQQEIDPQYMFPLLPTIGVNFTF